MSDLLKQAIADAKAVRATALANAKAALEEAFTPKMQSMLAEKLKQEVADAEGNEEALPVEPQAEEQPQADASVVQAEPAPEAQVPTEEQPPMEEETEEEMEEVRGTLSVAPDGAVNSELHAGTFVNEGGKASSNYKAKTKGHKTEDPQGQGNELADGPSKTSTDDTKGEPKAAADSHAASSDYKKKTSGHKTQDPQGRGNELSKGGYDKDTAALCENEEELDEASLDEILAELEASVNEVGMEEMSAPMEGAACYEGGTEGREGAEMDEEIDLDELLSEETEEDLEEGHKGEGTPGHEAAETPEEKRKEGEALKENLSLKKELEEYRSAVEYLRNQINEINLLNAKLLYTNKLFKAANLDNAQKMKVIESFDLTKSVREAKLVYATLAESFSFGGKKTVEPAKKPASTTVKTITEGLASKPVASTKPTKPAVITEGAEMANRFKKLAGIRN